MYTSCGALSENKVLLIHHQMHVEAIRQVSEAGGTASNDRRA